MEGNIVVLSLKSRTGDKRDKKKNLHLRGKKHAKKVAAARLATSRRLAVEDKETRCHVCGFQASGLQNVKTLCNHFFGSHGQKVQIRKYVKRKGKWRKNKDLAAKNKCKLCNKRFPPTKTSSGTHKFAQFHLFTKHMDMLEAIVGGSKTKEKKTKESKPVVSSSNSNSQNTTTQSAACKRAQVGAGDGEPALKKARPNENQPVTPRDQFNIPGKPDGKAGEAIVLPDDDEPVRKKVRTNGHESPSNVEQCNITDNPDGTAEASVKKCGSSVDKQATPFSNNEHSIIPADPLQHNPDEHNIAVEDEGSADLCAMSVGEIVSLLNRFPELNCEQQQELFMYMKELEGEGGDKERLQQIRYAIANKT